MRLGLKGDLSFKKQLTSVEKGSLEELSAPGGAKYSIPINTH